MRVTQNPTTAMPQQDDARITALMNASNDLAELGQFPEAIALAEQAWPLVGLKDRSNGMFVWVIESLIHDNFAAQRWDEAANWAQTLIAHKQPGDLASGDYLWLGKIQFEQGLHDLAYDWFDQAFRESKAAFQGEDKTYKAFYLQEKARR